MSNTLTAKIIDTKRAGTSLYGNPSYDITLETRAGDTLTLRTSSNVMFAYACTNPEYKEEWHVYELTRAGRIKSARTVPNYLATSDCRNSDARAIHNEHITSN